MNGHFLICVASLAFALSAQQTTTNEDDNNEEVFQVGADVSPPKLIHKVDPSHVPGSGTVVMELIVTSKGLPRNVRVIESAGKDLDGSALAAVKQWRFDPARKKDQPVAVRVTVEIRFHDI